MLKKNIEKIKKLDRRWFYGEADSIDLGELMELKRIKEEDEYYEQERT